MSEIQKPEIGSISWMDLTVKNAPAIRDFYNKVVGWKSDPVSMGEYDDYCMNAPETGRVVAGVCHARGINADLPPVWLVYITVANLETSMKHCVDEGGTVIAGPKSLGQNGRYCVIRDPAGAVAALHESA